MIRKMVKELGKLPHVGQYVDKSVKNTMRPLNLLRRKENLTNYLGQCLAANKDPCFHMGCANSVLPDWFNCDFDSLSREVNYLDATKKFPIDNNSFKFVFSEHFIEHLSFEDGLHFFKEAHRVLKPGGVIRTVTPCLEFVRDIFDNKTEDHQAYVQWYVEKFHPNRPKNSATVINHLFYGFGHKFIYDFETLKNQLVQAGFHSVSKEKVNQSRHARLSQIESHGQSIPAQFNELESLVVEATK